MKMLNLSLSGLSVAAAVLLAFWEVYYFWFSSQGSIGTALAWLVTIYLSYQLISIPFAIANGGTRFMGVIDGMASLLPLAVVIVVLFGKSNLLATAERWETAVILLIVNAVDLFGGYAFNIALSRRTVDVVGR